MTPAGWRIADVVAADEASLLDCINRRRSAR